MPILFILVLGISLGEGFGQTPEQRLRVSVLLLDDGPPRFLERPAMLREGLAWLSLTPERLSVPGAALPALAGTSALLRVNRDRWFPHESWGERILRDLGETADIRIELIETMAEAKRLVANSRRAAVLVLGKNFSKRVERCSFLAGGWQEAFALAASFPRPGDPVLLAVCAGFQEKQWSLPLYALDGLNPFHREGVNFDVLDVQVLKDDTQQTAAAIIDQVAQGSMLRVIMPWMIGRAFEKLADPEFLALLAAQEQLPWEVRLFLTSPLVSAAERRNLSMGLQHSIQNLFPKYNLTAKTWTALTRTSESGKDAAERIRYQQEGAGWLKRGSWRYQLLVPSYLVMFAFFLVLSVGWLFVAERRQGTLMRLRLAPLTRGHLILGKLLPCLAVSLFQGLFLLGAGRVLFGMSWGPQPLWLLVLVACTSLAAMGLALLIAVLARTETQVATYGTLIVLVLAGLSGGLMGDRSLMPERMQQISRITPHAWALDAYRQLLTTAVPNLAMVGQACLVLAGFGVVFLALAWVMLRLD